MLVRKKKETRESDNKRDSGVKMLFMRRGWEQCFNYTFLF